MLAGPTRVGQSKIHRTIADLDHVDRINTPHIAAALQYRKRQGDWIPGQGNPWSPRGCKQTGTMFPEFHEGFNGAVDCRPTLQSVRAVNREQPCLPDATWH